MKIKIPSISLNFEKVNTITLFINIMKIQGITSVQFNRKNLEEKLIKNLI